MGEGGKATLGWRTHASVNAAVAPDDEAGSPSAGTPAGLVSSFLTSATGSPEACLKIQLVKEASRGGE